MDPRLGRVSSAALVDARTGFYGGCKDLSYYKTVGSSFPRAPPDRARTPDERLRLVFVLVLLFFLFSFFNFFF
jgi:hypothetical protein